MHTLDVLRAPRRCSATMIDRRRSGGARSGGARRGSAATQ
jgi:hypothetical protein